MRYLRSDVTYVYITFFLLVLDTGALDNGANILRFINSEPMYFVIKSISAYGNVWPIVKPWTVKPKVSFISGHSWSLPMLKYLQWSSLFIIHISRTMFSQTIFKIISKAIKEWDAPTYVSINLVMAWHTKLVLPTAKSLTQL